MSDTEQSKISKEEINKRVSSNERIRVFKYYVKMGRSVRHFSKKQIRDIKDDPTISDTEKQYVLNGYHVRYGARGVDSLKTYEISQVTLKRAWDDVKDLVHIEGTLYGRADVPDPDSYAREFPLH